MTHKQLGLLLAANVILALALAWLIESATVRRFMTDFDAWWAEREGSK